MRSWRSFLRKALGDLAKRVDVEDVCDGIADIEHEETPSAILFIGTGGLNVGGVAHAPDWILCKRHIWRITLPDQSLLTIPFS